MQYLNLGSHDAQYSIMQLGLTDGFQEIRRHTELPTAGNVSMMTCGGQHQDRGCGQVFVFPDSLDQPEAVRAGHVHICQDEAIWIVEFVRYVEGLDRFGATPVSYT